MEIRNERVLKQVNLLKPHPLNEEFHSPLALDRYQKLVDSIRELGVLQDLIVLCDGTILSGHQRWKIAKQLGIEQVWCKEVLGSTEEENLYLLVEMNAARRGDEKDLIKRAKVAKVLFDKAGVRQGVRGQSVNEIAYTSGDSYRTVRRLIKLLDLIPEFQQLVSEERIGLIVGNLIASVSAEQQRQLYVIVSEKQGEINKQEVQALLREIELSKVRNLENIEDMEPPINHHNIQRKIVFAKFDKAIKKVEKLEEQIMDLLAEAQNPLAKEYTMHLQEQLEHLLIRLAAYTH